MRIISTKGAGVLRDCIYVYQYVFGKDYHGHYPSYGYQTHISTKSVGVPYGLHQGELVILLFQRRASVSRDCTLEYQYWGILQIFEQQIGDYHENGNVRGRQNATNMGDLLQGCYRARLFIDYRYRGWILRKGVQLTFSLVVTKLVQRSCSLFSFYCSQAQGGLLMGRC